MANDIGFLAQMTAAEGLIRVGLGRTIAEGGMSKRQAAKVLGVWSGDHSKGRGGRQHVGKVAFEPGQGFVRR